MLNPSLKSRFMEKFNRFSRILAGLVGSKISPLENKKRSKNKKTLKNAFFIKIIKKRKKRFLHLCWIASGRNNVDKCIDGLQQTYSLSELFIAYGYTVIIICKERFELTNF